VAQGRHGRANDLAAVGFVEAGEDLQEGGLAGAVGAAEAHPLAVTHRPGDAVEQDPLAEGLGEGGELNHFEATRLRGYEATRLRGCEVARLRGHGPAARPGWVYCLSVVTDTY